MTTSVEIMKQFGEFLLPDEIAENVEDIVGYQNQKDFLSDFFDAVKTVANLGENQLPFAITLSALLIGPPGSGKTTLAKAYAKTASIPIFLVYADSLIGSILGKTLNNIRDVLQAAQTYARGGNPIVVFFDELDAIASERSSVYEVGEIKRAVVTLLQRMDAILGTKDPIAFLGATNHQHLLDSAVWRRFCYHITFPFPDKEMRGKIISSFIEQIKNAAGAAIQVSLTDEQLSLIASEPFTGGFTGADLKRGFQIAVLRALKDRILDDDKIAASIQSAGGTQAHIDNERRMSGRDETDERPASDKTRTLAIPGRNKNIPISENKVSLKVKKVF